METINAIGRRKASVARVYLTNGSGKVKINGKEIKDYFPQKHVQDMVLEPVKIVEQDKAYDINVNVNGGGFKGQSQAISLAIARALVKIDADFKPALKQKNLMTRDARVVERKKFGKPKARKSFQFSKR
jgi:small subunit ribosomal protein S9